MASAKDIIIKPINARTANAKCKQIHYSGKVVPNSQLHFGIFLNGKLEGVAQYGGSIDKRKVLPLVKGTLWSGMLELNRMAFSDALPKYSESRAMSIMHKIIKKNYPQVKWILSFSDACQCGDGAIYRASGFYLTGVKKNTTMLRTPDGEVVADKTFNNTATKIYKGFKKSDCKKLTGNQLRYILFLDKSYKEKLTVPILPFSKIDEMGAGMYKGERLTIAGRNDNISNKRATKANSGDQLECGGAIPTHTLQSLRVSQ